MENDFFDYNTHAREKQYFGEKWLIFDTLSAFLQKTPRKRGCFGVFSMFIAVGKLR